MVGQFPTRNAVEFMSQMGALTRLFVQGERRCCIVELNWVPPLWEEDGETVFRYVCKMGLEGIVSKRRNSPYRSGRSPDWLKMKNPACEAVRREEEEDWGKDRR